MPLSNARNARGFVRDEPTRREVLQAGALASLGFAAPGLAARAEHASHGRRCICLLLVGGPSQLDTFDPKPDAPSDVRGPFRPIRTNVPGILISELFPRTARQADKFALIRSVHHAAAPVHDAGHQLMQTGRLFEGGLEHPHAGCVVDAVRDSTGAMPTHVVLPHPIGRTGGDVQHGQSAGYLGRRYDPLVLNVDPADSRYRPPMEAGSAVRSALELGDEREALRDAYGRHRFGQSCLLARRLIERGTSFVTVNMFATVFNAVSWDMHGAAPFTSLASYRDCVGPMFDAAFSTLLADLHARGLLQDTLVVAMGEFGRTPRFNCDGGRDHWPHCWSILLAGGGVKGGQVIGESDAHGAFPRSRPTTPAEVVATIYHSMGIDPATRLRDAEGHHRPILDPGVKPIMELFC